jgi:DNA topoisomerase-1
MKGRGGDKERAQKKYKQKKEQLDRLRMQMQDKDENKQIALGTSKLNYLDPRISVAWFVYCYTFCVFYLHLFIGV